MITYIIIALAIMLAALLVDWPKLMRGKVTGPVSKKPRIKPKKQVPASAAPNPKRSEKSGFSFDVTEDERKETEVVVPEEQVGNGHASSREVEELLSHADVHFRKGEMKAAEKYYLQAAAKDPRCSKAYSRLGVIYLEDGDNWSDAEEAFRQALKTDPNNGYILNNLGLVLYHQDKFADAIRQFEQAVRQDELNAGRHANLGMANMAMRQYAKAESSFKKALKLAPQEMEYKDLLNESIEKKKAHKTMIRH